MNNKAHKLQIVHLINSHTNIIIKKTERKEADLMEQPRVIYQPFKRLKMALRSKKRKRSSITMGGRDNDTGLALLHLHVSLCQVATGDAIRRDDALSRDRRTFLYSSPLPADEGAFLFREA